MKKSILLLTLLTFALPIWAQVLPGYERTGADMINNKTDRDGMKRVEEEIEGIQDLDLEAWKSRAVTWGIAEFDGPTVKVGSEDPGFYDMEEVRTKRTKSELKAETPIVTLDLKKKNRDLWLTLPKRAGGTEIKCKMEGRAGAEHFGVFLLENSGFVCLSRAVG